MATWQIAVIISTERFAVHLVKSKHLKLGNVIPRPHVASCLVSSARKQSHRIQQISTDVGYEGAEIGFRERRLFCGNFKTSSFT